ncbi:hypothetical protein [Arthrobacter yangruifuii]|uniref:hypothetical protein n=1 Tax=Arthrobacter yangruifuii TaxID=2606616 RepID=UPI001646189A|nr:hypothetical protein [Arthrobacter yangruifuii]
MAMGSGARKAIVWGGGALAGVGLLVASFFAGTAVAENDVFEQADATTQEQDAGTGEGRDSFDEQDSQDQQDEQDSGEDAQDEQDQQDKQDRKGDGGGPDRKDGGRDAEDRDTEGQDTEGQDAERPGDGQGRHDRGPDGHRGHHGHDGDGGPEEAPEETPDAGSGNQGGSDQA